MKRLIFLLLMLFFAWSLQAADPYIKLVKNEKGDLVLQTAVRIFKNKNPKISDVILVGAIHIGEPEYYKHLQTYLDHCGILLFESISRIDLPQEGIRATYDLTIDNDFEKMSIIAHSAALFYLDHGHFTDSLYLIAQNIEKSKDFFLLRRFNNALFNHENRSFFITKGYVIDPSGYLSPVSIASYTSAENKKNSVISNFARTLKVIEQKQAIRYDRPNFKWCDLSLFDLHQVAQERQINTQQLEEATELLSSKTSANTLFIKTVFTLLNTLHLNDIFKSYIVKMLYENESGGNQKPKDQLIIDVRNDFVLSELDTLLHTHSSIGIFYGCGHLPDIERKLCRKKGFYPIKTIWINAIHAKDLGGDK